MDIKVDTFHFGNVSVGLNTYGQDLDQSDYDQKHNYRSPVIDYVGNGEEIDFEITVRDDFDQAGSMTLLIIFMTDGDGTTGDGFDNTYKRWQFEINMDNFQKKFNATEEQFTYTYHVNVQTSDSNYPGQWLQYIRFRLYYADEEYPYCPIKSITIHSDEYWDMVQLAPHPIGAPMISDAVATPPYPNALWQIDGVHNNGFPFIVLMPYLPYTPILPDQEAINFLDKVRVRSLPHGVNQDFIVSKVSIPLSKPEETKYSLGKKLASTFTESTNSINSKIAEQIKQVPKVSKVLKSAKENAAALINSATNGYVTMVQEDGHTKEIVISNEPDYMQAQQVWRWNQNGLAHSSKGYEADEYDTAITMDGSIVADRITAGTMQADRIRGGTLLLGGFEYEDGKDGELKLVRGENREEPEVIVLMNKDGAFVNGEIYGESQDTVQINDQTQKYFIRVKDGEIIGGITPKTDKQELMETVYGKINARAEIDEYDNGVFKETHRGWLLQTNAFMVGDSDEKSELRCKNFSINEYKGTSCKVSYVSNIKPKKESVNIEGGGTKEVVTDIEYETTDISFWYGILNTDTEMPPDEPPKNWSSAKAKTRTVKVTEVPK